MLKQSQGLGSARLWGTCTNRTRVLCWTGGGLAGRRPSLQAPAWALFPWVSSQPSAPLRLWHPPPRSHLTSGARLPVRAAHSGGHRLRPLLSSSGCRSHPAPSEALVGAAAALWGLRLLSEGRPGPGRPGSSLGWGRWWLLEPSIPGGSRGASPGRTGSGNAAGWELARTTGSHLGPSPARLRGRRGFSPRPGLKLQARVLCWEPCPPSGTLRQ